MTRERLTVLSILHQRLPVDGFGLGKPAGIESYRTRHLTH
jgi:hypothetical protein